MANHNLPTNTSAYTDVLSIIDQRLDDIATGLDPAVPGANMSNLPLYAVRWSSVDKKWLKQTSAGNWADLETLYNINISGNAATVTNGVYTNTAQTIGGQKTFSSNVSLLNGTAEMQVGLGSGGGYAYGNTTKAGFGNGTNSIELDLATGDTTATGNITALSDISLKTDLIQISDALTKVCSLTGYTYTRIDTKQKQTGLIAQDVEKILPEATLKSEKYLSIAYGNLVGLLVEAIKDLNNEIKTLKAKL
jgi:hypothetical protein